MGKHKVTIYRPRLERVVVSVSAPSKYAAEEVAFGKADALPPEAWEMLPTTAQFFCGESSYDPDMFATDSELIHRTVDGDEIE